MKIIKESSPSNAKYVSNRTIQHIGKNFNVCNFTDVPLYAHDGHFTYTISNTNVAQNGNPSERGKIIFSLEAFDSDNRRLSSAHHVSYAQEPYSQINYITKEEILKEDIFIPSANLLLTINPVSIEKRHPNSEECIQERIKQKTESTKITKQPITVLANDPRCRIDKLFMNFNNFVVTVDVTNNKAELPYFKLFTKEPSGYIKEYHLDLDEVLNNKEIKYNLHEYGGYVLISTSEILVSRETYNIEGTPKELKAMINETKLREELESRKNEFKKELEDKKTKIENLKENISNLKKEHNSELNKLKDEYRRNLDEQKEYNKRLDNRISEKDETIKRLTETISEKDKIKDNENERDFKKSQRKFTTLEKILGVVSVIITVGGGAYATYSKLKK